MGLTDSWEATWLEGSSSETETEIEGFSFEGCWEVMELTGCWEATWLEGSSSETETGLETPGRVAVTVTGTVSCEIEPTRVV
jgi:hypothetical protein